MLRLGGRGFGRHVEIIIIVAIVATIFFLVAVVIGQKKLDRRQNEAAAIASLKAINTAMEKWSASQAPPSYSGASLSALTQAYPTYIDAELAKGIKEGYSFTLFTISDYEYICIAIPLSQGVTGIRTFCITESGVVKANAAKDWQPVE